MPIAADDYRALIQEIAAAQARLSSAAWYFTGEDQLRLTTFGSLASVTLAIEGRMLDAAGHPQAFARPHTPQSDRTSAATNFSIGEGFLLNVAIRASAGAPRRGQVYAILEVVRGVDTTLQSLGVLWEGYVTATTPAGWPGTPAASSIEGPGVIRSIAGTDPAADTEISEAVPTNARWRLLAARFTLVTDATAANREVALTLDDGATVFNRIPSRATHVASTTIAYSASLHAALETVAQDTERLIRLPPVVLQGGHRLNTVTTNRQATDNYGAPQLLVEEWIED